MPILCRNGADTVTTRFLVGDVHERMAELPDHSFDLIVTSPPFLALRSYLPDGHPLKAREIGSEPTPAAYLDVLLALTAEWRRLLAPHGSIAVELGDTYAGSGGAGGDYKPGGWRAGQNGVAGSMKHEREHKVDGWGPFRDEFKGGGPGGAGWPLPKSLTGIPTLYAWSLAYGRNLLTGQESPAGQWRIRNLKPWIRSNPPVGALGDKERPATSYITVACTGRDRWFDLDAVRTATGLPASPAGNMGYDEHRAERGRNGPSAKPIGGGIANPGGAPPLDWWHQIDALIDNELDTRARDAGKSNSHSGKKWTGTEHTGTGWNEPLPPHVDQLSGARGVHIRRRLEAAGYLHTQDAYDVSPRGYAGAHYAVWPPELVRLMVDEMCARRVCRECGVPSRRIVEAQRLHRGKPVRDPGGIGRNMVGRDPVHDVADVVGMNGQNTWTDRQTLGWSDCGHDNWRPGRILDPFVGSGTTLAVASGMGRDSVGIDLNERNADLARERVGMFLEIDYPSREVPA